MTMKPTDPNSPATAYPDEDEIDLRELLRPLWRARRKLMLMSAGAAVAMVIYASSTSTYTTQGFFRMPGVSITSYKQYLTLFANENRFNDYVKENNLTDAPGIRRLRGIATDLQAFMKTVSPEFAFTAKDSKEFGVAAETTTKGEKTESFIGFKFLITGDNPSENKLLIKNLAEFIRDNIMYTEILSYSTEQCSTLRIGLEMLRTKAIQGDFAVRQNSERIREWEEIIQELPTSKSIEKFIQFFGNNQSESIAESAAPAETGNRTIAPASSGGESTGQTASQSQSPTPASADDRPVVSVQGGGGGERFLSPIAQLVAVKAANKELELTKEQQSRERTKTELTSQVYCQLAKHLETQKSGRNALVQMEILQKSVFSKADMNDSAVEEADLALSMQRERWRNLYLEQFRFLSEPTTPEWPTRKFGRLTAAALGAFLGLFLGALGVLLGQWWANNREAIVGAEETPKK